MNFSELPNPYDFANPVADPDLFAGRTAEMEEIKYYLNHASKSPRAINLAIIGQRASGKTSVLNMIQLEASKRGFCVVRVDLDESDAESQLAFFCKLFDSIFTTVCFQGVYGGLCGKTYDVYRDMVDAYEVPKEKTFCPLIFPIQYAKAMSRGNFQVNLSDTAFKHDISCIQAELGHPIAILLDECDVLTRSRIHLEKLRNIFMNSQGFMLVFTGTPALFPLMDDVFSPIIRQFKKINVGPFSKKEETERCIRRPLERVGISNLSEVFDFETYYDVSEIHDLSGGRPYEIQLICHFLFRRVQEGRAKRMELTVDVLDDVLKELQTSQDVFVRPVITAVRSFDKRQLEALRLLCSCNGYATFDQVWLTEYVFHSDSGFTEESLREHLSQFEKAEVISIKDNITYFMGDDFDRVYCKYLARKHGVPLSINDDLPCEVLISMLLDMTIQEALGEKVVSFSSLSIGADEEPEILEVVRDMSDVNATVNPFESTPDMAAVVYWSNMNFRRSSDFQVASVVVSTPWMKLKRWYGCEDQDVCHHEDGEAEGLLDQINSVLSGPAQRIAVFDGDLRVEVYTVPIIPIELLSEKVLQSGNERERVDFSGQHFMRAVDVYLERRDIDEALFHCNLAHLYDPSPEPPVANNLGYMYMAVGNLSIARELLEKAEKEYKDLHDRALPNYNLGVIAMEEGDYQSALSRFRLAIEQIESEEKEARICACLLLPKVNEEGELEIEELTDPDLLETAQSAVSTVGKLLQDRT